MVDTDQGLRDIVERLSSDIDDLYSDTLGFALIVFPHGTKPRGCNYFSNCDRKNMILALREAVDQIEKSKDIPTPIGNA